MIYHIRRTGEHRDGIYVQLNEVTMIDVRTYPDRPPAEVRLELALRGREPMVLAMEPDAADDLLDEWQECRRVY